MDQYKLTNHRLGFGSKLLLTIGMLTRGGPAVKQGMKMVPRLWFRALWSRGATVTTTPDVAVIKSGDGQTTITIRTP